MPVAFVISATVQLLLSYIRIARFNRSWSIAGRPPLRPLALAALSPSAVRSRIRSRSISANPAIMVNTIFPMGEVVSSHCSFRLLRSMPDSCNLSTSSIRPLTVRPRRDNSVTIKLLALLAGSANLLLIDSFTACRGKLVYLAFE